MTRFKWNRRAPLRHRVLVSVSALAAAAACPIASARADTPISGDPVLYWNQVLISSLPASPVFSARHAAIFNVAVHDAVNAASGNAAGSYLPANPNPSNARAAASAAAYQVLKALYPANTASYTAKYNQMLALIPDGPGKAAGIATGNDYAGQILTLRAGDGWNASVSYSPSGLIGRWAPTPNAFAPAAVPQWGQVTPFLMTSGDQFRPGPPPTIDSPEYTAAYNEVMEIGALGSLTRTLDQSAAANYWVAASGPGPWMSMALKAAEGGPNSPLTNASILAQLSVGIMDASIGICDTK